MKNFLFQLKQLFKRRNNSIDEIPSGIFTMLYDEYMELSQLEKNKIFVLSFDDEIVHCAKI